MRKSYDFTKAKRGPYAKLLKKQITIRLDQGTVDYFKDLAGKTGMPYQSLMNLYLRECAAEQRKLHVHWGP